MPAEAVPHDRSQVYLRRALRVALGCVLIAVWGGWWFISLRNGKLWADEIVRVPAWKYLGLDFQHNYLATLHWLSGGNPYLEEFGDWRGKFAYPPLVLPLFAWCGLFGPTAAMVIWMGVITGITALAAKAAHRTRAALGVVPLPLVFMLGLLLCSQPVVFATERGQTDAIVLAMIVAGAAALQRPASWARDVLIGTCFAVAAWVKVYPAVLILGLLALSAWRAFGLSVIIAGMIGLLPLRATTQFIRASAAAQQDRVGFLSEIYQWLVHPSHHRPAELILYPTISVDSHSLTTYWATFWNYFPFYRLAHIPGVVGAALILAPITLWVSWRVYRCGRRSRMALPYLLWVTAAATFGLPVSYDYNLIFLPLAALAVCARRDGVAWAIVVVSTFAWAQPLVVLPFPGHVDVLFFLKLISLMGAGFCLLRRAQELDNATDHAQPTAHNPPARMVIG